MLSTLFSGHYKIKLFYFSFCTCKTAVVGNILLRISQFSCVRSTTRTFSQDEVLGKSLFPFRHFHSSLSQLSAHKSYQASFFMLASGKLRARFYSLNSNNIHLRPLSSTTPVAPNQEVIADIQVRKLICKNEGLFSQSESRPTSSALLSLPLILVGVLKSHRPLEESYLACFFEIDYCILLGEDGERHVLWESNSLKGVSESSS